MQMKGNVRINLNLRNKTTDILLFLTILTHNIYIFSEINMFLSHAILLFKNLNKKSVLKEI